MEHTKDTKRLALAALVLCTLLLSPVSPLLAADTQALNGIASSSSAL
ncbi:MAG: hypothetical protein HY221_01280, partial [Candidatus Sungbacteria bacterium]|nr:hypothetical protein [Candidatus Sungbacteria bacterium]